MKILFIGPQGSGKSTQAKLLAQFLNLPYLSSGDIFREIAKDEGELGQKIREMLNSGRLVDDQTTCEVVKKKLEEKDYHGGFIMDGFPRTLEQIKIFDPGFNLVFYLDVSKKISLERLLKRVREDDTPEVIEKRLIAYYIQTHPLLEYFNKLGILKEIDGEKSIDEIQDKIREFVG